MHFFKIIPKREYSSLFRVTFPEVLNVDRYISDTGRGPDAGAREQKNEGH